MSAWVFAGLAGWWRVVLTRLGQAAALAAGFTTVRACFSSLTRAASSLALIASPGDLGGQPLRVDLAFGIGRLGARGHLGDVGGDLRTKLLRAVVAHPSDLRGTGTELGTATAIVPDRSRPLSLASSSTCRKAASTAARLAQRTVAMLSSSGCRFAATVTHADVAVLRPQGPAR